MITTEQLLEEGFEAGDINGRFVRDKISVFVHEGKVTFIQEYENYHGLNVMIDSIQLLKMVLSVIV